ncbi:hypothetical protein EBS02_04565, partial [bacterium]|nr:hypothetical protein [bacterium]
MVDYINFDIDRVVAYEHIAQLIQDATDIIELNKKNIANLDGFEQLILPIEKIDNELQKNWSLLDHLQNVDNKNELRESHQQALDKITDFQTKYALDKELMGVYEKASNQKNLNIDEKLLLDHALLNFKLAGVDLDDQKKQRIFEISQALTQLSEKFGNNLLDTSERWTSPITAEALHGLSEAEL